MTLTTQVLAFGGPDTVGPGAQAYKLRLADASAPVTSVTLRPVGRHLPVLAGRTRDGLARRLRRQA